MEAPFNKSMHSGIYISVPFCRSKCTYCNFASGVFSAGQMGRYVERLGEDMRAFRGTRLQLGAEIPEPVDSIYLGGGTPSLLAAGRAEEAFLRAAAGIQDTAEGGGHGGVRAGNTDG